MSRKIQNTDDIKIADVKGIDDYAMLREVINRRYRRLLREKKAIPNLILIDGGLGHLSSAEKVIRELGLLGKVDLACIAKGKFRNTIETDEILLPGKKQPIYFRENSPSRFFTAAYSRRVPSICNIIPPKTT